MLVVQIFYWIAAFSLSCGEQTYLTATDAEEALFQYLFERNYNKWVRPVGDLNEVMPVYLKLTVRQLLGVDEKNQLMHTNVWLKTSWFDKNLMWNPKSFGNLTRLRVPAEWIWLPDIVLLENTDGNFAISHMTRALLHHDGNVTWEPPATYKSWCNIDVTYFPFDVQNCSMKFASWTYPNDQMLIKSWGNEIDVSQLLDNGEWEIVDAIVTIEYNSKSLHSQNRSIEEMLFHQGLRYFIVLKRLPLFYTVFLITPCLGISYLAGLVFYLPTGSKEKITLCTSVLLAHTFYLLVITEIIPSTSNTIPMIGEYLIFTMIFITLSIIVTTIVISIYYRTNKTHRPIPSGLRLILLKLGPKLLSLNEVSQRFQKGHNSVSDKLPVLKEILRNCKLVARSSLFDKESCFRVVLESIQFLLKRIEKQVQEQKAAEEWMYAAMVLDRILLIIFFCISSGGTVLLFLSAYIH